MNMISGLMEKIADFVLLCTVLHEVDDKPRLMLETARICRSGGTIAVIEFNETNLSFGPPMNHRLSRKYVEELFNANKFNRHSEYGCQRGLFMPSRQKSKDSE